MQIKHGLEQSIADVESLPAEARSRVASFLDGLMSHYVLDGGKLVVAHAGLREEMHGRGSGAVREFCLYGETTGVLAAPGEGTILAGRRGPLRQW